MKNKDTDERSASCSECPSTFKLVPPADQRYVNPREKPTDEDYIKRIYECEDERHRNTVYWGKKDTTVHVATSRKPRANQLPIGV